MKNKTILVVDDNVSNLEVIVELLDSYTVMDATCGKDALEIVNEEKIDLILLDIVMPAMNGFEVCEIIKSKEKYKNIPIIFITSKLDEYSIKKAYELGATDYITKPCKPMELLSKVKKELQILDLVNNLEIKIQREVEKNKQQQLLMLHQSRLAQMGKMISMIAHQWRQPLNNLALINQSIILKYMRGKLNDELMDYFKENSNKQITQMTNTIDDFRDFFKPEKEKVNFNLDSAINQCLEIISPVLKKEEIKLNLSLDKYCIIDGYPNEFGQAILNIISNGNDVLLENNIEDKQIDITLSQNNTQILLTISDNGGGIADNVIDKIFDPYFSTKNEKNGTGLGLYMTKLIIENHMNGIINVSNNDKGAVFIIMFNKEREDII